MHKHLSLFVKTTLLYALAAAATVTVLFVLVLRFLPEQQPRVQESVSYPKPHLTTMVWGIFDTKTGEVISGENIDMQVPIASVSKLFTAETVLRSASKDKVITIDWSDVNEEGRAGKLTYGATTTPYLLLYPLLLESSNDAAHAIVRTLGNEFSDSLSTMTDTLALTQTLLQDGSGLSAKNVSSVRDLAKYYAHIKATEPHILDITTLHMFVSADTGYVNNDPARSFLTFMGGKHGYTDVAQKTFVGAFKNTHHSADLGIVVLKSTDLKADIQALLAYGENL